MTKLTKKRLGMSHYENSKIRISHLAVRQDLPKVRLFGQNCKCLWLFKGFLY